LHPQSIIHVQRTRTGPAGAITAASVERIIGSLKEPLLVGTFENVEISPESSSASVTSPRS